MCHQGPTFFEGHLNGPALDEVQDDAETSLVLIRREVSADGPLARWITSDDPADWQVRLTSSIPQSGSTASFNDLRTTIVPDDIGALPHGVGIDEHLAELRQAFAFDARMTIFPG